MKGVRNRFIGKSGEQGWEECLAWLGGYASNLGFGIFILGGLYIEQEQEEAANFSSVAK